MYKLTNTSTIIRTTDGASIPADPDNNDYADYLKWAKTNTPEPADIPPAPTYRELRAVAYPPIGDQLDAMWKGGEPEAAMKQTILAVKAQFPKQ